MQLSTWILAVVLCFTSAIAAEWDDVDRIGLPVNERQWVPQEHSYQALYRRVKDSAEWDPWTSSSKSRLKSPTAPSTTKSTSKTSRSTPTTSLTRSLKSTSATTLSTIPTTTTSGAPTPSPTCDLEGSYQYERGVRPVASAYPYPGGYNYPNCRAYCVSQNIPNLQVVAHGTIGVPSCLCFDLPFAQVYEESTLEGGYFSDITCPL